MLYVFSLTVPKPVLEYKVLYIMMQIVTHGHYHPTLQFTLPNCMQSCKHSILQRKMTTENFWYVVTHSAPSKHSPVFSIQIR
nr:unnamed protein product [Callosobruchus analis]